MPKKTPRKRPVGRPPTGRRAKQIVIRLSDDEFEEIERFRELGDDNPPPMGRLARGLLLRHAHSVLARVKYLEDVIRDAEKHAKNWDRESRDGEDPSSRREATQRAQQNRVTVALAKTKLQDEARQAKVTFRFTPHGEDPEKDMWQEMVSEFGNVVIARSDWADAETGEVQPDIHVGLDGVNPHDIIEEKKGKKK